METLLNELTWSLPDAAQAIRVFLRLLVATLLAAIIGYERGRFGLAVMSVAFAWVILAVLSRLGR